MVLVGTIPALSLEINDANLSSLVILDLHLPNVFDIHLAKYQILYNSCWAMNSVVLACRLETNVLQADWHGFHVADRHAHFCMSLHREFIVIGSSMSSGNRRMMTDLLTNILEAWAHVLICFAKDRVKGLRGAPGRASILSCAEASYKH